MVIVTGKQFGREVGKIISRWDLVKNNSPRLDELANVVVADVDMFDLPMILRILHKHNRPSTITLNHLRNSVLNPNFIQPRMHPHHLLGTPGHGNVLSLNSRESYHSLSLATPGNSSPSHREDVSRGRMACVATSSIVCIDIG